MLPQTAQTIHWSELPPAEPGSPCAAEWETFRRELGRLLAEGHEGKFYCWTKEELTKLLTAEEFKMASRYFGITEKGNFLDHSHPSPLPNQNVLSIVDAKLSEAEKALLSSAKKKMFEARSKRIRPHLDDKVLASWNGLMLGAMARASAEVAPARKPYPPRPTQREQGAWSCKR